MLCKLGYKYHQLYIISLQGVILKLQGKPKQIGMIHFITTSSKIFSLQAIYMLLLTCLGYSLIACKLKFQVFILLCSEIHTERQTKQEFAKDSTTHLGGLFLYRILPYSQWEGYNKELRSQTYASGWAIF